MINGLGRYAVIASKGGERSFQTRAAMDSTSNIRSGGNFGTTGSATLGNYEKTLLDGFVNINSEIVVRGLARDMYYHDPISGSAVDMQSELPFSDFTLSGLPDQDMLKTFAKSIEALSIKTLLPELTRDYQVDGAFVGTMNFDEETKSFTSVMPQNLDYCEIMPLPIYGRDPVIDLKIPKDIRKMLEMGDERIKEIFERYGDDWKEMIKKDRFQLDPKNTLYIPRRTFSTNPLGVSLFRRMIPIWTMEKALLRGTIDLAYRRQKAILHAMAGDEEWEPTNAELQNITQMIIQADADPTGAVIATRPGIQFAEIRAGNDFWRYDEMYDFFSGVKMRALGISEAFLGGDATYNNMETSLSVFIEQIRSFREMITRKLFYNRLFPLIAHANDFTVERYKKDKTETTGSMIGHNGGPYFDGFFTLENEHFYTTAGHSSGKFFTGATRDEEIDLTKLLMPKLQWHKQLKPEADRDYLDMLTALEEKGLPIPLRVYAAAGGISLPEIMTSLDEDINLRKRVDAYNKKKPKPPQAEAEEMFSGASALPLKKNRNFDHVEMRDPQTGKVLSRKGRKVFSERMHKTAASALANIGKRENHKAKMSAEEKRIYSYMKATRVFGNTDA